MHHELEADFKALYYFLDFKHNKKDRVKAVSHKEFDGKVDRQKCN